MTKKEYLIAIEIVDVTEAMATMCYYATDTQCTIQDLDSRDQLELYRLMKKLSKNMRNSEKIEWRNA